MNIFPDNVSPEEAQEGFVLQKAKIAYGTIFGEEQKIDIVIRPISCERRFLKSGEGSYSLQELKPSADHEQFDSWVSLDGPVFTLDDVRAKI